MIKDLLELIHTYSMSGFEKASQEILACVEHDNDFLGTLAEIGTIPEAIEHDSTEEKLFSKATDAVLARAFREIGLKAVVLTERGDSADVLAASPIHGYTLVADSKAFRMSRTAKNQKDFKVSALSGWRKDNDFAILCAPYFQYPSTKSQIYAQALDHNVCLISWEHFSFLIANGIKENSQLNLSEIWNCGKTLSKKTVIKDKKKCIIPAVNKIVLSCTGFSEIDYDKVLSAQKHSIFERAAAEIGFWEKEREKIQEYTREQAINELLRQRKINEKIAQINAFIERIM